MAICSFRNGYGFYCFPDSRWLGFRAVGTNNRMRKTLRVVHGKVTDENGAPIVGANVWIKGTMVGVATDVNGDYTLRINPEAKTLSASFIGYSEAEKTIMRESGL